MKKRNIFFLITLSVILLISLVIACWRIDKPGFYYDELLFVNAARGGKTDLFVRLRLFGIPFLLMDYIGALKAWLYYPLFSIFPINYWTVRLPSILLGIAGGFALVVALWRGFGKRSAIAGAVMILLDPTLITHSRLDWGPNALMFFFRGLLIFFLIKWIQTSRSRWAWLALAVIGFGIFDKLNFIWIAFAAVGALVILYSDKLKSYTRLHPKQALALTGLGASGLTFALVHAISVATPETITWGHRFSYAFHLLRYTLSGGGALNFISGDGLRLEHWIWPGYLLAGVAAIGGFRRLVRDRDQKQLFLWSLVFMLLLAAAFILTKSATGPHHSSVLSGIWQFCLAPLMGAAWEYAEEKAHRLLSFSLVGILLMIGAGNCIANVICIRAFKKPTNVNWDPVNTKAASFVKTHPNADFITTDWGMGTLLAAEAKDPARIRDAWPIFTQEPDANDFIKGLPKNKDLYLYTTLPAFENFKGNRANLTEALQNNHVPYDTAEVYSDWQGQRVIEIWHIRSAGQ